MGNPLTKSGVIFGVFMFYVIAGAIIGMIPSANDSLYNDAPRSLWFKIMYIEPEYYNATTLLYKATPLTGDIIMESDCNNYGGTYDSYFYPPLAFYGKCYISIDASDNSLWSFNRLILNIQELKWLNTILLLPLIALIGFLMLTSSAVYNVE